MLWFRTSIQCASWCLDEDNCNAFVWDESKYVCTLKPKDGLCLDKQKKRPKQMWVDQGNVPPPCQGILH